MEFEIATKQSANVGGFVTFWTYLSESSAVDIALGVPDNP